MARESGREADLQYIVDNEYEASDRYAHTLELFTDIFVIFQVIQDSSLSIGNERRFRERFP